MKRSARLAVVTIALAALLVVSVLPAAADGPIERVPVPGEGGTITGVCAFPVVVTFDLVKATQTTWMKENGNLVVHSSGVIQSTWANGDTGYSLRLNISGPMHMVVYSDGSSYMQLPGPQLLLRGPAGIAYNRGLVTITRSSPGAAPSMDLVGNSADLCAALSH